MRHRGLLESDRWRQTDRQTGYAGTEARQPDVSQLVLHREGTLSSVIVVLIPDLLLDREDDRLRESLKKFADASLFHVRINCSEHQCTSYIVRKVKMKKMMFQCILNSIVSLPQAKDSS